MPNITVPDHAAFYVRGALNRAIDQTRQTIKKLEKNLADPSFPETFKEEAAGMIAYQRQWLREAQHEFKKLPVEIRPYDDYLTEPIITPTL